jgi:hypothetical protein
MAAAAEGVHGDATAEGACGVAVRQMELLWTPPHRGNLRGRRPRSSAAHRRPPIGGFTSARESPPPVPKSDGEKGGNQGIEDAWVGRRLLGTGAAGGMVGSVWKSGCLLVGLGVESYSTPKV